MSREKIRAISDWLEDRLRSLCGSMTAERRLVVVLTAFVLFAALSRYVTASAIYNLGKDTGERLQIRHIEGLKLEHLRTSEEERDSTQRTMQNLNDETDRTTE